MPTLSRRLFTKTAAISGTACSLIPGRVLGANERINLGLIGCGVKGCLHLESFSELENVTWAAVSDPDTTRMDDPGHWKRYPLGSDMTKHQDFRRILDMKEVDAVVIATPNHWHAPATIMACEAGKHVYVEKPVSHTMQEGLQMVEAARRHKRIVQAGLQQRSCPAVQECAADVQSGRYGKVLWVHTFKLMARKPIGKRAAPMVVPDHIDYGLWAGSSPQVPIFRNKFHYDWHWMWNWGNGEIGNWGVHYLDDARHILGWDDYPDNAISVGGRWWDDVGETPSIQLALMEHRGVQVVTDIRIVEDYGRGDNTGAVYRKARHGNIIMCEKGYIRLARGGGKSFNHNHEMIHQYKGTGGAEHAGNFIDAMRQNNPEILACDIEVGHRSTMMSHLANASYRAGKPAPLEKIREALGSSQDALDTLESILTQLKGTYDLGAHPFTLGEKIQHANEGGA